MTSMYVCLCVCAIIVFSTVRGLVFFYRSDDPLHLLLYVVKVYTTNCPLFRENCNFSLHWKKRIKEGLRGLGKH